MSKGCTTRVDFICCLPGPWWFASAPSAARQAR